MNSNSKPNANSASDDSASINTQPTLVRSNRAMFQMISQNSCTDRTVDSFLQTATEAEGLENRPDAGQLKRTAEIVVINSLVLGVSED